MVDEPLDLGKPSINWQHVAQGMSVSASRATTAEEFHVQFAEAMQTKGPHLIEAIIDQEIGALFRTDGD